MRLILVRLWPRVFGSSTSHHEPEAPSLDTIALTTVLSQIGRSEQYLQRDDARSDMTEGDHGYIIPKEKV